MAKGSRRQRSRAAVEELPLFAAAQQHQSVESATDLEHVGERPLAVSTGLQSVDALLGGGFPVGGLTFVAARARVGSTSLLIGSALEAMKRNDGVAYFSERLDEKQVRGRFVVLESRVNGYRFKAGFATAEDRIALAIAREQIPWSHLSIVTGQRIDPMKIDRHVFSYRPLLVVADVRPRSNARGPRTAQSVTEGLTRLASIARKQRVAVVLCVVVAGEGMPRLRDLPLQGDTAEFADSIVFLNRDTDQEETLGQAELRVVRHEGDEVGARSTWLRFDQRFAGLLEP